MQINYISDLHLEFDDLELPGGEVLILAGDVCEIKNVRSDQYDAKGVTFSFENRLRRPDRYIRFFVEECAKYEQVFYVMGNHEHYHGRFDQTESVIRSFLPANVHLLQNSCVEYRGVQFMGASLWTDLNRNDPITAYTVKDAMNDYRVIKNHYENDGYGRLIPMETFKSHRQTLSYFGKTLKAHSDQPFVIVTHHAPSFASVADEFKSEYHMNGAYASDLSEFILDHTNIRLWFHGHMHNASDYHIGTTRILTNPRGYAGYERRAFEFDPGKTVELSVDRVC